MFLQRAKSVWAVFPQETLWIKKSWLQYAYITLVCLISIRFWSFKLIPGRVYDLLDFLVLFSFIGIILFEQKLKFSFFKINILLFIILPLVSAIGAYIYHGQSFISSLLALRLNFFWVLYFILHIFNLPSQKIIKLIVIIGFVWIILTILQQFSYPYYYFYTRSEAEGDSILRAGVYRFMLYRHHYGLFLTIFFFFKYLNTKKKIFLSMTFLGVVGFYFFGTRQFLAVTIICLATLFLIYNRNKWGVALFILLLISGILYYFSDVLFGRFIELTQKDLHENNIRLFSAAFYLNEYWPESWFAKIIGNGANYYDNTIYGKEITYFENKLGYYRGDVGIIGSYNEFGLLYLLNILVYNIRAIKAKFYNSSTQYLRVIFLSSLILLPLTVYFSHYSAIPFFCFLTYLTEKTYSENHDKI